MRFSFSFIHADLTGHGQGYPTTNGTSTLDHHAHTQRNHEVEMDTGATGYG
jgi:hypothetical protein